MKKYKIGGTKIQLCSREPKPKEKIRQKEVGYGSGKK
jgi:hypothetical protein